ncbi:major facilitator superfamily domain-containing protein [Penicillium waksmanii]|uniref:major facilitator superfamily domain-containing protein n=1 Tax=Penicillium waksmanii TaxID=69791 RepID=UPI002547FDD2|nr:major facilitator superfamily domain-containing protein [Penicillium waksmanii]KAJ5987991.1 major facilitator superfamily domain-containing protein [Penicillium waksmanii]
MSLKVDPENGVRRDSDLEESVGGLKHEGDSTDDAAKVEDDVPPDGGSVAWLVVLGAWCCSFTSPGWINSMGSFQAYYEVGPLKNYSSSTISWIPSLQIFFVFALGPVVGILFDKYGPRPLIIAGTVFHVFGLMMASLAKTYYQFILSQGICSAIGVACLYSPALACVATWFSKKRGAAMGIMATGGSLGGVIFPIMISRMIQSTGYPWAMRTAAFLILGLQLIAILTIRPRTKPVPKKMPLGRLTAPFKELPFVMLLLGAFILTYGILIPVDYMAVQASREAHMSEQMSQYLVSIFNAASLFGRLASGYGADKIGRWNIFIVACSISGITQLAVWIPATHSSVVIGFAIMFGFFSGAFIGLSGALPASVSPLPEIGYRLGIMFLSISIPALTMAPVGGAILQNAAGGWLDVKIFAGVMSLGGSAIVLYSRMLYTENKILTVF